MKLTSVFRAALPKSGQSLNSQTFALKKSNMNAHDFHTTVRQRLRPLVLFIRVLVLVLLTWSAGNGILFASAALRELTDDQSYAVAGGLAFVILFESGKCFFGTYTLRMLIRRWWQEGFLYRFALILLIPVTAAWFAGSYWLSTHGSLEGLRLCFSKPASEMRNNAPPVQPNTDIEAMRMARDSAYRQALSRSAPRTAARLFMAFQSEITRLETQQAEVQQQQKTQSDQREQQLKNRFETVLNWLSHFGGWSEVLTLLLLVFLEMYTCKVTQPSQVAAIPLNAQDEHERYTRLNYLKQRARQCWRRAHDVSSNEKTRRNNLKRAEVFFKHLGQLGINVAYDREHGQTLDFTYKKQFFDSTEIRENSRRKRKRSRKPQPNNHVS